MVVHKMNSISYMNKKRRIKERKKSNNIILVHLLLSKSIELDSEYYDGLLKLLKLLKTDLPEKNCWETAAGEPGTIPLIRTGWEMSEEDGYLGCLREKVEPNFPLESDLAGTIPSLSSEHGVRPTPKPNCDRTMVTRLIVDPL